MLPRTSVEERITLHVFRLLPPGGEATEGAPDVARPSGALRAGLSRADREHHSVLREVKATFYYGNATPSVVQIDRPTADDLCSSLGLRETVLGVWGPTTIQHEGARYEVWIQDQLCG